MKKTNLSSIIAVSILTAFCNCALSSNISHAEAGKTLVINASQIEDLTDEQKADGWVTDYDFYNDQSYNNNKLTINGNNSENVGCSVYGGFSIDNVVNKNILTINGGTFNGKVYGGKGDTALNNTVIITDGIFNDKVYGGNGYEKATDNIITITGGTFNREIYGGYSKKGSAINNKVIITGGKIESDVLGGEGEQEAVSNTVTITDGEVGCNVYGGASKNGKANNNAVTITGVEIGKNISSIAIGTGVFGGISANDSADKNTVEIAGSKIYSDVYGGKVIGSGNNANNNIVKITESEIGKSVCGGFCYNEASSNTVTITNSGIIKGVYGGRTFQGNADKNIVSIADGSVAKSVYGGYSFTGSANDNAVIINGSTIGDKVCGGYSENGNANNNNVKFINSKVEGPIIGGLSMDNGASSNIVIVDGSNVTGNVYGGRGNTSSDNTVKVTGSSIGFGVIGGYSYNGNANNNKVTITGNSTIGDGVYGGFSVNGTADNNTITISGNSDLSKASLYGSNKKTSETTGNKLIIDGWSGKIQVLDNFNEIALEKLTWKKDQEVVLQAVVADVDGTSITVNSFAGGSNFAKGENMQLLKADELIGEITKDKITVLAGVSQDVSLNVTQNSDEKGIGLTVNNVKLNKQTDLLAQNRTVAAAFVNQGSELVADALDVLERDTTYGTKTFAAVYGNRSKYDVNSDLKINGWSSIVGVGSSKKLDNGDVNWGVFYENGSGNYRTFNSFNDDFFRGDGSLVYNGGGAAVRYNKDNGVYVEGSLRAGSLKSEMSNALHDGAGASYGYKSKTNYYGAHLGIGKVVALNENSDLDVYGKFFHTYNDGDSFSIASDKFEFDSITSDRLQIGARLVSNKADKWSTYYGLAYEYEFIGDSDMRAQNISAPTQSLQGSTYIGEIGANFVPDADSPWSFDMRVRGYAGEREGFSGNVQAVYSF